MTNYEDYIKRQKAQYGKKFSAKNLTKKFIPYFNSGQRIKIRHPIDGIKFGTIGVTTGWVPVFLLMGRSSQYGSSITLDGRSKILAVQVRGEYVKVR